MNLILGGSREYLRSFFSTVLTILVMVGSVSASAGDRIILEYDSVFQAAHSKLTIYESGQIVHLEKAWPPGKPGTAGGGFDVVKDKPLTLAELKELNSLIEKVAEQSRDPKLVVVERRAQIGDGERDGILRVYTSKNKKVVVREVARLQTSVAKKINVDTNETSALLVNVVYSTDVKSELPFITYDKKGHGTVINDIANAKKANCNPGLGGS